MIIAILQKKETSAESQRFDKLTKGAKTPYQWRYLHHSWIPAYKFRMVPDLNIWRSLQWRDRVGFSPFLPFKLSQAPKYY